MKKKQAKKINTKEKSEKEVRNLLATYKVDADETNMNYCGCCGDYCA